MSVRVSGTVSAGVFVFLTVVALMLGGPSRAFAQDPARVQAAMATMMAALASLGSPKLEGETLSLGTTVMNGNYAVVDDLMAKHGCTATVFARKGDNYIRITTNVVKDGKRAVGTLLDPSGPAISAIRDGKAFYGLVDIIGKIYDTGYEPIRDAEGKAIGIMYVGYSVE